MERFTSQLTRFIISALVCCILFAAPAPLGKMQTAEAFSLRDLIGGVTGGGQSVIIRGDVSTVGITNTLKNTLSEISTALIAGIQAALKLKELTLDGLAWNIAQSALNQMTADIVSWINGGFNGDPAFVTDLEDYLLRVSDETAGRTIYGPELDQLCEPIQFPVRAALYTQYTQDGRGSYTPQCTIDRVDGVDVEAFMRGDFSKGGWGAFMELGFGSNNDPTKAYLNAEIRMYTDIAGQQELENEQLRWSDGFLSKEFCESITDASGFTIQNCERTTPGTLIRDMLSYHVGELPTQKLVQADEFNEIISALASSLGSQAIRGTFGVLGLGGNAKYADAQFGAGSDQVYLEVLLNDQNTTGTSSASEIDTALAANEDYRDIQQEILDDIEDLEDQIAEGEQEYPNCFDLELSSGLELDKADAEANLEVANQVIDILEQMKSLAENGSLNEQSVAYQQYMRLQAEGLVRTAYDVQRLRAEFINFEFEGRVDDFQDAINNEIRNC